MARPCSRWRCCCCCCEACNEEWIPLEATEHYVARRDGAGKVTVDADVEDGEGGEGSVKTTSLSATTITTGKKTATTSTTTTTTTSWTFVPQNLQGASQYFRLVSGEFKLHFGSDEEIIKARARISTAELPMILYRCVTYREARAAQGLVDDPSDTLPGGASETKELARRFLEFSPFADLSYELEPKLLYDRLHARGYSLITFERDAALFRPSYYLAMNRIARRVLISVKGTSTSNDWLTNLFITPQDLIPGERSHGGVVSAARYIFSRVVDLLSVFRDQGYDFVLAAHSLGAGVAGCLAVLLKEEAAFPESALHAYLYAPPPAFSPRLAEATKGYIHSCVHHDDVIPRSGVKQIKTLILSLGEVKRLYFGSGEDDHDAVSDNSAVESSSSSSSSVGTTTSTTRTSFRLGGSGRGWGFGSSSSALSASAWEEAKRKLDTMSWNAIRDEILKGADFQERVYDTVVPGRILFLFSRIDPTTLEERYSPFELRNASNPALRLPILSSRMMSDHSMVGYAAALENVCYFG